VSAKALGESGGARVESAVAKDFDLLLFGCQLLGRVECGQTK